MEPFFISCTTCQAKLKVRDASAIGQILTCPKCGSMVLIEQPATESTSADSPQPTSLAPTQRPPVRRPPSVGPAKRPDPFADTVEDPTHYGTAEKAESNLGSAQNEPEALGEIEFDELAAPSEPEELASVPDADWQSDAARQRKFWLLAGICLVAGISLAIVSFVYVVGWFSQSSVAQESGAAATVPASDIKPGTGTPPDVATPESPAGSEAKDEVVPAVPTVPTPPVPDPSSDGQQPSPVEPTPVEPAPVQPNQPITPLSPLPAVTPPGEPQLPQASTEKTVPSAPLDLVPKDDEKSKADRMAPDGSLTDTLRRLGGLLNEPDSPEAISDPKEPVTATPVESEAPAAPAAPKLERPAPREINLAARLADPITNIEVTEVPLVTFLQFVTQYSTIPVSLDPDSLVWLNLTPTSPVTINATNTTVNKLLDSTLSKMGLAAVPIENHLLVTRRTNAEGALRKTQRKVEDLIGTDATQGELLLSHLKGLVAPDSWSEQGGKGTANLENGSLVLEQSDTVLIEVSAFLERLRVARGLPKQSKFDEKIFQPITRTVRATEALSKPVTLNYSRPTSFDGIVRRISQDLKINILIDWQAIAEAGWSPDAVVTFTVSSKPLREALDVLLQPMELSYRVVDESTFQITTAAAMKPEIEFYPVAELLHGDTDLEKLLSRLNESLPPEWFAESGCKLSFDPPSRCLVALLQQPRQQALEKLLNEWKTSSK